MGVAWPIFIFAGILNIVCAACDFEWFINSRRVRFWVDLFGRDGARIFYIVIGIICLICGIIGFFMR